MNWFYRRYGWRMRPGWKFRVALRISLVLGVIGLALFMYIRGYQYGYDKRVTQESGMTCSVTMSDRVGIRHKWISHNCEVTP